MKGVFMGDKCDRDGCKGIIEVEEKEGSCSCHINPPCSHCTDAFYYCPKCDWNSRDEHSKVETGNWIPFIKSMQRTSADLDKTKIDWLSFSHTHFTMIKDGVYPEGTPIEIVREMVKGTFGGRFEYFGGGRFRYIAYTD